MFDSMALGFNAGRCPKKHDCSIFAKFEVYLVVIYMQMMAFVLWLKAWCL